MLRDFQQVAIQDVLANLDKGKSTVLVSPTGSGKTVMGASVAMWHAQDGQILWVAHRRELVRQAASEFYHYDTSVSMLMPGVACNPRARIIVASKDTLKKFTFDKFALVVIDECHHATSRTYDLCVKSGHRLLGLTATPFRLDGRPLGKVFQRMVIAARPKQLIDDGFLVRPKIYAPVRPDLKGVRKTIGEYNLRELADRVNTSVLRGKIVEHWKRIVAAENVHTPTVAFCVNVAHAESLTDDFRAAGVPAACVHGNTDTEQRDATLAALAGGHIQVICNCMLLTEGWDLPSLECCIIARPTASLCLHLQMCGRIMRSCPGKDGAIIIDHAGNCLRLGDPIADIDYTLDGITNPPPRPRKQNICRRCGRLMPGNAYCPRCVVRSYKRQIITLDDHLRELPDIDYNTTATDAERMQTWERVKRLAQFKGYKLGWAKHAYHREYGEWPPVTDSGDWIDLSSSDARRLLYAHFHKIAVIRGHNRPRGWAYIMTEQMLKKYHASRRTIAAAPEGQEDRGESMGSMLPGSS